MNCGARIFCFIVCMIMTVECASAMRGNLKRRFSPQADFDEADFNQQLKSKLYRILIPPKTPYLKKSIRNLPPSDLDSFEIQPTRRGPLCYFTSLPCPDFQQLDFSNNRFYIKN
ncbi:hypothetical protein M3Y97_01139400 [Aphelenchoides bicaudatus]|nr:hypothetical protein M3Y97_01139400 [Aphelenchoides bicaudatus]